MVKVFMHIVLLFILSLGLSCYGQSSEVIDFKVNEPVPATNGEWIVFSKKKGIEEISSPFSDDEAVLLMAKAGLLQVLNEEGLPLSFDAVGEKDDVAKKKVDYRLAYGAKPDSKAERYVLRWERTAPVLPKYITLVVDRNGGNWTVNNQSYDLFFWYVENTWSRHHGKIFSPSYRAKNQMLMELTSQCEIDHSTKFILDVDCIINNLQSLTVEKRSSFYSSLK